MKELEEKLENLKGDFELMYYHLRQLQQEIAATECDIERAKANELEENLNKKKSSLSLIPSIYRYE